MSSIDDLTNDNDGRQQRGIQSIEVGGQLLHAMAHMGRPMALKDLAREADMPAAKIHAYLVSFTRIGLMKQDSESGRYFLGPLALQLGLISLKQANPVQAAAAELPGLTQRIGHTAAISVWGSRGATIVRLEESPAPIHVNMRQGTVFSLTNTATGRLFAAYQSDEAVKRMLDAERALQKTHPEPVIPNVPPPAAVPTWSTFLPQLREVRQHGLSRSEGETLPGVNAMAVPVFDHGGEVAAAITAIGPAGIFDLSWNGPIARELRACAQRVAHELGAPAAD
ncbi:MAG TPA: IclR family transcriptional regulator [Burkholderiaceae bacterium]|jgi:DNA-binding IclR family transcriptional regulator|nr:IclR family transcriptional regulator [Burkholderiaceae bacterium]